MGGKHHQAEGGSSCEFGEKTSEKDRRLFALGLSSAGTKLLFGNKVWKSKQQ